MGSFISPLTNNNIKNLHNKNIIRTFAMLNYEAFQKKANVL